MTALLTRSIADAAAPGPLGQQNQPITGDSLAQRVTELWQSAYGAGGTARLLSLGAALTEYALAAGEGVRARRRACESLVRGLAGDYRDQEERRLRLAVCLHHLALRLPGLRELPAEFARAVVEASRAKIDWSTLTDDLPALAQERLATALRLLTDLVVGARDGRADSRLWRRSIKALVCEGQTLADYRASEQAAQAAASEQTAPEPVAEAVPLPDASAQDIALGWLSTVQVGQLAAALAGLANIGLLERLTDAAAEAATLLVPAK